MMIKNVRERFASAAGTVSGGASILGSWQVCHNLCLGAIAVLSAVGITVAGMPLLFLTEIALPLWSAAVVLLAITFGFYFWKRCISTRLLMVNTGLIVAGVPFAEFQSYITYFWIVGGALVFAGIAFYVRDRINRRTRK